MDPEPLATFWVRGLDVGTQYKVFYTGTRLAAIEATFEYPKGKSCGQLFYNPVYVGYSDLCGSRFMIAKQVSYRNI